jgi:uncharacterized membrane protein YeaQ/YmgE (transglycosylase-associated protein family)
MYCEPATQDGMEAEMAVVWLIIVGAAGGFVATRLMRFDSSAPATLAIGVLGAILGSFAFSAIAAIASGLASLAGAVFGAALLIWLWKSYAR